MDFETHVPGWLIEALWLRQEGHPKLKYLSAPIMSSEKNVASNPTNSYVIRGKLRIKPKTLCNYP